MATLLIALYPVKDLSQWYNNKPYSFAKNQYYLQKLQTYIQKLD